MASDTDETKREGYVAALRFPALDRAFDPVVRLTMREARFKRELLAQAALRPGHRVLDLGCGTGTLAILAKEAVPGAEVVGLDGDPQILEQARAKADAAGVEARFDDGFSTELPYGPESFDRVLSTLFFHHLTSEDKRRTVREIIRVLRPGGELHIADFTRPSDPLMALAFLPVRFVDGFERTRVNARGELGALFSEAGLRPVTESGRLRTAFGTLGLMSAVDRGSVA
jgi:cyclopropane fatty-acyl-phospholipid synthase-like methyltransferase